MSVRMVVRISVQQSACSSTGPSMHCYERISSVGISVHISFRRPSLHLSVSPFVLLSAVHPAVRVSSAVRLSVCPSVRLSVCPSVRLSVCPSVRMSAICQTVSQRQVGVNSNGQGMKCKPPRHEPRGQPDTLLHAEHPSSYTDPSRSGPRLPASRPAMSRGLPPVPPMDGAELAPFPETSPAD